MNAKNLSSEQKSILISRNRKAFHEFSIIEQIECGIVLTGTEVKAIKGGAVSMNDAYARIKNGELFLYGLHVSHYSHGNIFNHTPRRIKKLLANRREILRMFRQATERGNTLIPLSIRSNRGLIKIELGICRGKQMYDKRATLKQRDIAKKLRSIDD